MKLLCKKTIYLSQEEKMDYGYRNYDDDEVFTKGNYYTISNKLSDKTVAIIKDNKKYHYGFHRKNKDQDHYLWNWFYTEIEIRKLKLEKLNNGRNSKETFKKINS